MNTVYKAKRLFWISFVCEGISASTFLWMPFVESSRTGQIMIGMVFWIFLICGYVCIGIANHVRKASNPIKEEKGAHLKQKAGMLGFFSNIPAAVFDFMLIAACLLAVITGFTKLKETYLPYPLLSFILFSLHAHGMFNGRVYLFTNSKQIKGGENHG